MPPGSAHFGRLDVVINNIGGTIWARPFAEYQPDQIEKEIRRSLFPTLWGCRAALPWMLKQGKGSIVNVSSVATAALTGALLGGERRGQRADPFDCYGVQRQRDSHQRRGAGRNRGAGALNPAES